MYPHKRFFVTAAAFTLAACDADTATTPTAHSSTEASGETVAAATTLTASYTLQVGQTVSLKPRNTSRTNRLKWTTSNSGVASVNSQGTVSARAQGAATVTVSGSGTAESYGVSVVPVPPKVTGFSLQPSAQVSLLSGQTQQYVPAATWSDGKQYPVSVTYTATGGTISSSGLFTAGNLAGTFMVVASCACATPAITDTSYVSVQLPAQLTKLTISPKTVALAAGGSQAFTVTANWSTGATTLPPVSYSVTGGSITSTGQYTAPSTAGTYRVIVAHTNGTVRDTATVTVAGGGTTAGDPVGPVANPWSVERNFNGGIVGQTTNRTATGFDDVAGASIFSSERFFEGGQSSRLSFDSGATAFGTWGGALNFPATLREGSDFWLQLYIYIPQDFVIRTPGNGSLKFIRIRTKNGTGGNGGYNDIQLNDDAGQLNSFRMIKETQDIWYSFGAANSFSKGVWQRVTVNLKMHSVPSAVGGGSRVRVWQNGRLLIDENRMKTLSGADHFADALYLFTYWNGGAPKAQSLWVDQILMANYQPTWASDLERLNQ